MIFDALANFQFDFILRGGGFTADLRAVDRVPGDGAGLVIVRFFFRGLPRMQHIFARRDVFELERAVASYHRFGVTNQVIGGGRLGRDQVDAKALRKEPAFTGWNDLPAQACRALGDYHFDSRNFFALLERDAGARNVDGLRRRGLRNRADVPAFIGQVSVDSITTRLKVHDGEAAVFIRRGGAQ